MQMMEAFGQRQQELLKLLLNQKQGLSVEKISSALGVSRPAARQHLVALERLGYVERGALYMTGGRPGQSYRLTSRGYDLFPKQYSWFSEILLTSLSGQLGSGGLQDLMSRLGDEVGAQVGSDSSDGSLPESLKSLVEKAAKLMNDLAYQAQTVLTGKELPGAPPVIEASNCVYHGLAARFPEVCQFDIALLSRITGAEVVHEQCIVRGGSTCRFRFKARAERR